MSEKLRYALTNEELTHYQNAARVVCDMLTLARRKTNFVFPEGVVFSEKQLDDLRKSNPTPHEQHFRSATQQHLGQYLAMGKDLGLWRSFKSETEEVLERYADGTVFLSKTHTDPYAMEFGNPFVYLIEKMREERAAAIAAANPVQGPIEEPIQIYAGQDGSV